MEPRAVNLLFTCVGRRVELLQAFRAAARRLGIALRLIGTDRSPTAPGLACVDVPVVVPSAEDSDYVPQLCRAIQGDGVHALIPTIDNDLVVLSENRERFTELGCRPLIASPDTVKLCRDKIRSFEFLRDNGIDTPETFRADDVLARKQHTFPYFVKPRFGFAGNWARKVNDQLDLEFYARRIEEPIIQEFVFGREYTLDAYVGLDGRVRCIVPRARWQVRAGEVIKGVTVKNARIMEAGRRVVDLLGPSLCGVVTIQCIVTPEERIRFIEVNPRFGGGAPLAIAAGADFPGWLLQELLGEPPRIAFDRFRHGVCMLRYDWSAFVQLADDLQPRLNPPLRPWPEFD